jgi:hypothetical protein
MDYGTRIRTAMNSMRKILDVAKAQNRDLSTSEQDSFDGLDRDIQNWRSMHERENKIGSINDDLMRPVPGQTPYAPIGGTSGAKDFGNFCGDLAKLMRGDNVDNYNQFQNAATGMSQSVQSDGGFAVSTEFSN